uniref:Uncharacterized protein n=1 Tax=Romanomermis culicivorax TaxID=13658 RepID=A0A915J4E0_ROMCU
MMLPMKPTVPNMLKLTAVKMFAGWELFMLEMQAQRVLVEEAARRTIICYKRGASSLGAVTLLTTLGW